MKRMVSFWTHHQYDSATGCWNWRGNRHQKSGYGKIRWKGKTTLVHRLSAHFYFGLDLTSKLLVMHHCDNPSCFNPKHLFIGTAQDNMDDKVAKGRWRGNPNQPWTHCSKGHPLTAENTWIRNRIRNGRITKRKICKICRLEWEKARRRRMRLVNY